MEVVLADSADGHELYHAVDSDAQIVIVIVIQLLEDELDHGWTLDEQVLEHLSG